MPSITPQHHGIVASDSEETSDADAPLAPTARTAKRLDPTVSSKVTAVLGSGRLKVTRHLFVFRGRRGSLIKVLWHDGQGMCLFAKRLERGRFIWPSPADGTVAITPAQLGYLLEGIDWRMPQRTWRPQAAS